MATAAASSSAPPPPPQPAEPAADPPAKEEPQNTTADAAAPVSDAGAAVAAEEGETVILDAAAGEGDAEGEEEGECGFCLFMKGGGCREEFVGWEKCVEDAEKAGDDVVERCYEVTAALHKCMEAHAEYYHPILSAERAMAADLEAAKADQAAEASSDAAASSSQQQQPPPTEEEAAGEKKQAEEEAVVPEKQDVAAWLVKTVGILRRNFFCEGSIWGVSDVNSFLFFFSRIN